MLNNEATISTISPFFKVVGQQLQRVWQRRPLADVMQVIVNLQQHTHTHTPHDVIMS